MRRKPKPMYDAIAELFFGIRPGKRVPKLYAARIQQAVDSFEAVDATTEELELAYQNGRAAMLHSFEKCEWSIKPETVINHWTAWKPTLKQRLEARYQTWKKNTKVEIDGAMYVFLVREGSKLPDDIKKYARDIYRRLRHLGNDRQVQAVIERLDSQMVMHWTADG